MFVVVGPVVVTTGVGVSVGYGVGVAVGVAVGTTAGGTYGGVVGLAVGFAVGLAVGFAVGVAVGVVAVGVGVFVAVAVVAAAVGVSVEARALATLAYEVPLPNRKRAIEIIRQVRASVPITMCLGIMRMRALRTRLRAPWRCQKAGPGWSRWPESTGFFLMQKLLGWPAGPYPCILLEPYSHLYYR